MKKRKIDWCDCTVNPVVGCPNGCEYCYGRVLMGDDFRQDMLPWEVQK